MAYFERGLLDQSPIASLTPRDHSEPSGRTIPAEAPRIMVGDGRDYSGSNGAKAFTWRPTLIVVAVVLIAFLGAAFL